jgi:hypothetical protein
MAVRDFAIVGPRSIELRFDDGVMLRVEFDPQRMRGLGRVLLEEAEFMAARLVDGTVCWPCGYRLDVQLARVRADEGQVWRPLG